MRGRKPQSADLQIVAGDPRRIGKAKLEAKAAREVKAQDGLPPCPLYLKGYARGAYNFYRRELQRMDIDRKPDGHALECVALAYEDIVLSSKVLAKQGRIVPRRARAADGTWTVIGLATHPALRQRNAAMLILRAFAAEFGLTPTSRLRLSVEPADDEEDDLFKLLSQPRTNRRVFPEGS
jgi:P27 family predicted phage terminase small subunit